MSSGSKQLVQYAKEVTFGVTPTPFARTAIPFTSISLGSEATKEDSTSILDSRLQQRGAIVSVNHQGDLGAEARYGVYDDFLASNAFNDWAGDVLTFGGDKKNSLSLVRGYKDAENYHTFSGVLVNTFELNVATESIATFNFGLMAKGRIPSDVLPAGTVTTPEVPPPYTNVSVGEILLDGISQAGIACISEFSFSWDNSIEVQRCLGLGTEAGNLIATMADGTGSFTMAWSKKAAEYYEKQFTNTLVSVVIPFVDSDGNGYTLTVPKMEVTMTLPEGGGDDILQATVDYRVVEEAPTLTRSPAPIIP